MKKEKKKEITSYTNGKSKTDNINKVKNKIVKEKIKTAPQNEKNKVKKILEEIKNKNILSTFKKIKIPNFGFKKEEASVKREDKKLVLPKLSSIYQTDFDRLCDVIEKENTVPLSKITGAFNVDKTVAQRWGEILNENELIEYRVPAFGEPEFIKKGFVVDEKKTVNKKKRIIVGLSLAGVVLVALVGFFIINGLIQNTGDKINVIRPMPESERGVEVASENVKEAFSGNGTYVCRGGEIWYYIKDQLLRAESVDKKSTVIVKSGVMYTYDITNDKWVKTNVSKGVVLPGSGKDPSENLECKKEDVNINLFDVPGDKII
ncbi:hypothetical protein HYV88_04755 [Candidatus Woesearchaeota archaeon]|nr:hypothetical protein [Candidatus Woesearchaeota archaeon]